MAVLSAADLAGVQATYADWWALAAQQATLYDSDGASHPYAVQVLLTNVQSLKTTRISGAFEHIQLPASTVIAAGQVLSTVQEPAGLLWFLVREVTLKPSAQLVTLDAQTRGLPLVLNVQDVSAPIAATALDFYGSPRADGSGYPTTPTTKLTVRAGLTNDYEALTQVLEGNLPTGLLTAYVPLGSAVPLSASITVVGDAANRQYRVTRAEPLYNGRGEPFALELVLDETAGEGWKG